VNGTDLYLGDLWEFNPSTNEWTWMGGSNTAEKGGIYGTLGTPAAGNVPGCRAGASSWTDSSGNFWFFGGNGCSSLLGIVGNLNDLWEFNPSTNEWAWMSGNSVYGYQSGVYGTLGTPAAGNTPGSRGGASNWTDLSGNLWLFGGSGVGSLSDTDYLSDLWEFNPSTSEWTWMGGSNTANQSGVYGTLGTPAAGNIPGGRYSSATWTDPSGNFWLFGGYVYNVGELNDLWEYNTSTNQWAWISGSSAGTQPGVYGTLGTPAAGNMPGGRFGASSWIDSSGNFWLFGGQGFDAQANCCNLNDLWEFNPSTSEWTWMSGSSTGYQPGVYGTLGTPAAGNVPGGGRDSSLTWTDPSGNLWLFGGLESGGSGNRLNDLWRYQLSATTLAAAATPTFSVPGGTYATAQTVTISDATADATIYYTTNGTTPTTGSSVYSSAITVSSTETLEAIATASGSTTSALETAAYTITSPAATPIFSVPAGTYITAQTVSISDTTSGAAIYYTTNGTTPSTSSTVYNGAITVSATETLEAIATASGYTTSNVATAAYAITPSTVNGVGDWTWMGGSSTINQYGVYGTLGTPAAGNIPGSRSAASTWTDSSGNLWLFGGYGLDAADGINFWLNDLWEFNPSTNLWTWMGGSSAGIESGVYGTLGTPAAGNLPQGREGASSWTDSSGNLWLFGGTGLDANDNGGDLNDLWEYNTSTNQWVWMSGSSTVNHSGVYGTLGTPAAGNTPGARFAAANWTDRSGNLWLFGGAGDDANGNAGQLNDLWEYNTSTNQWTWMGGSSAASQAGVYGTLGTPAAGNLPGGRAGASSWTDSSGNFWLFGGNGGTSGYLNDLWEFNPSTNEWTWMSGSSTGNQPGVYGTLGTPAAGNVPGSRFYASSWTDSSGNLWLFGGLGYEDLWEFNRSTNEWTWMSGSSTGNQPGVYGTLGTPAAGNFPGSRDSALSWTDSSGNLWLFGGSGYDANETFGYLNDLWRYQLSATTLAAAATPTFSVPGGTYASAQTVTISDTTPGAIIYYTTNETTPTTGSSVYSSAITVSSTETIEAIAAATGYTNSAVASAAYTISPLAATPTFSVPAGTYTTAQTVSISDTTSSAAIYYTTNGTTPSTSSTVYNGAITVSATETLEALATASGYSISAVATATYTITQPVAPSFTISSITGPQTVQPGGAATYSITVTAQNGTFPNPVTLTASGLPAGATAIFSPPSVTPGSSSASSTLTIQTANPAAALTTKDSKWPLTASALSLIGMFFLPGKRRRRWITLTILLLASLGAFTALTACGGGFGFTSSATSYTITITGSSGSVQQTTTVPLTVE
jgi:N-acetylneuraminic acid mutarotase